MPEEKSMTAQAGDRLWIASLAARLRILEKPVTRV